MKVYKALLYLSICFLVSGCFLMIGFRPSNCSFKYYNKNFTQQKDTPLKIDGFYYCKFMDRLKGDYYYSYLRFYPDGRVNSHSTAGKPDVIKESYWLFNDVWGYYKTDTDSVFYELKSRYGTYRHGAGVLSNDSLHLKIFDDVKIKRGPKDTTYYSSYVFHIFAAE